MHCPIGTKNKMVPPARTRRISHSTAKRTLLCYATGRRGEVRPHAGPQIYRVPPLPLTPLQPPQPGFVHFANEQLTSPPWYSRLKAWQTSLRPNRLMRLNCLKSCIHCPSSSGISGRVLVACLTPNCRAQSVTRCIALSFKRSRDVCLVARSRSEPTRLAGTAYAC